MCELLEEYAEKRAERAAKAAAKEAAEKNAEDSALKMLSDQKLTYEDISRYTGLSMERIEELGTLRHI